ncbi:polymer-forming cytoskeletal protein [Leifsonia soli]|uniref:Cytoskeletal protein CcmA (Bactofilin family) n=1 Tax=Leifsonia soli TaxID=582665 RepID=A0A852SZE2_9MICO|nr:polymer-forming cytoskeletal protein [Leifsonia soli]NYD74608.1 cytoskeletal protein CcmA (bactofilin family) [Leifsonia soli]
MNARSHRRRLAVVTAIAGILMLGIGGAAAYPAATAAAGGDTGPHFYTGTAIDVSGSVDGDVYAAGQSVNISGDVTGDVIAAAQTITVSGTVDGNIRLAGQDVTISGDVMRSGTIFASSIVVSDGGSVRNDIVAAAATITVAGDVGRDMEVSVSRLTIDGSVGGDVTYSSDTTAQIASGAVAGTVHHIRPQRASTVEISPWAVAFGWLLGLLYALVALSLITVAAGLLIPRWLERVTDQLIPSPWRALLVGFIAAIVVPFALLFLLVTIVGAPLALAGILVWTVLTLATFLFSAHYLGRLVLRGRHHPVLTSFVGGLILIVGLQIPWLNILVWLAMVFFGLGAQLLEFRRQRPWNTTNRPVAAAPSPAPYPAAPAAPAAAPAAPAAAPAAPAAAPPAGAPVEPPVVPTTGEPPQGGSTPTT